MKKIVALTVALFLAAPCLNAHHGVKIRPTGVELHVENHTDDTLVVAVPGTNHPTSREAVSLESWERRNFTTQTAIRINGPLRFALMDDMNKDHYSYYETSNQIFPVMFYKAETTHMLKITKSKGRYVIMPGKQNLLKKETTKAKGF